MGEGTNEGKDALIGKLNKLALADENSVGVGSTGLRKARAQRQRKENKNKKVSSSSLSRKGGTLQAREVLTTLNPSAIERLFDIAEQAVFKKKPYKGDIAKDQETSREVMSGSNGVASEASTRSLGEEQVTYSKRCARESDALLLDCPESLKHVKQSFLRQAEAFDLADQCNKGLGEMAKPGLLVSRVQDIPSISKDASSTVVEQSKDENQGIEKLEDGNNEIPEHFRFCFEELDKPAPALYGRTELSVEEVTAYEQAQNRYAQMIENLNKNVTHPIRKGVLPGGGEHGSKPANEETMMTDDAILSQPRYPQAIKVFCVEHKNDRSNTFYRKFTACALSSVWETYLSKDPYHLHWYEIIRENLPCHLYFDLEYPTEKGLNPDIDGNQLIDILIENVNSILMYVFVY